jgi:uncharacterized protein YndB with AHSA1/START domain
MTASSITSPDVRRTVTIAAPPERVFDAITTLEGLRGWWCENTTGADGQGGEFTLRWSSGGDVTIRFDRLERPHRIEWLCTGQHDVNFTPPDEWVGTRMVFGLRADGDGTVVDFTHYGLAELECAEMCRRGWEFYLSKSLPAFAETGSGMPIVAA